MTKHYVKKPIRIAAFKYGEDMIPEWFLLTEKTLHLEGTVIKTLEGDMLARFGDYIIKGIKGEIYPCKADIFEASYNIAIDLIEEDFY